MLKTLQDLFLVLTSVLFIVDPLTAVPTFLAMTARDTPQVRRLMARRGAWTCAVTLTAFALGGSLIFRLFGITIGAFKIAGGVLIGLNALDMVQARRSQQRETAVEKAEGIEKEDVGIMPLGVPMLAGPGAISTVMVLAGASKSVVTTAGVYVAIALTAFLTYITLAAPPPLMQSGRAVSRDASRSDCCSLRITVSAASGLASGSSTAKLSPPKRATTSLARIERRADSATNCSIPSAVRGLKRSATSL